MQTITEFDFVPLHFDGHGALTDPNSLATLEQHAQAATDVIFLAHGFRNDENDATTLYGNFLKTFRQNLGRPEFSGVAQRKFVAAGVYWPSKPFQESFGSTAAGSTESVESAPPDQDAAFAQLEDLKGEVSAEGSAQLAAAQTMLDRLPNNPQAQDDFAAAVLSVLEGSEADPTEGLEAILSQSGSDLLRKLQTPGDDGMALAAGAGSDGGVESVGSVVGSIFGAVGRFLNMTTWYLMKSRCGTVGATGVAQAVRALHARLPNLRIHLVGHSLGGRLIAACAKSLTQAPQYRPDSVTLLEAAFSHYGFSDNNGDGVPGFFRAVIQKNAVRGPLVATFSFQDDVVGVAYALASRVANDNTEAVGDPTDPYGGIGRNGCQKTRESHVTPLKKVSDLAGPYAYQLGIVNCMDGSGGLIKDHGDVWNENVTYAFASAVAAT
jgi:hypothetical protein